ncbi:MAG: crossover junction endodeoxyribonuclease RuvC [bacterium]|nr:crossover junction endodeoxyribonuclease RuvC [bacterium]
MLILGIDPGLAETGWGIIEMANGKKKKLKKTDGLTLVDYGCIKTLVGHDLSKRLLVLKNELQEIIIKHRPDCMAMEQLFFGRNAKTAMIVGLARGVMMVTAAEESVPILEYQGLTVKLNLSGDGRCSKSGMQSVVSKALYLKFTPRPQHASDALAVAIYHAMKNQK